MEKFEKLLSLFVKNPYTNIELSNEFQENFRSRFGAFLVLIPIMIIIFSLFGYFPVVEKINDEYDEFNQFYFIKYFYSYLYLLIPFFYLYIVKNYFHLKYKILKLRQFGLYYVFIFLAILTYFPITLLFFIKNITPITMYLYYLTPIVLFLIYYYKYYKRWQKYIFKENYNKYKKEVFKLNFPINSLIGKFTVNLEENKKEKPIFTKIWEYIATFMLRFGLTIPVLASIFGSSSIENYDAAIYFIVYMFLFMIPFFSKLISSQVIFYKFLKQIEKEEGVTIYNGRVIN